MNDDAIFELRLAIQKAAGLEMSAWDEDETQMRVFRVTRNSLEPLWRQFKMDYSVVANIPKQELMAQIRENLYQPLYEPVVELFADYLWFEEESRQMMIDFVIIDRDSITPISIEEFTSNAHRAEGTST